MDDLAGRRKHQGIGALARLQRAERLGSQGVQPAQPFVAGHREDLPARQLDRALPGDHRALFAQGLAEMPGHPRIRSLVEFDASHARVSLAHMYGCRSTSVVARSRVHSRSPSTLP
ncbi:hypothetical protein SDC9_170963 [bioreactor metagenome]|uniref:Uncharacterized protein n=1 Tax=bioreactor metagenome TaxID=1076179 RepID=A0A645G9J1_9ZZZZ